MPNQGFDARARLLLYYYCVCTTTVCVLLLCVYYCTTTTVCVLLLLQCIVYYCIVCVYIIVCVVVACCLSLYVCVVYHCCCCAVSHALRAASLFLRCMLQQDLLLKSEALYVVIVCVVNSVNVLCGACLLCSILRSACLGDVLHVCSLLALSLSCVQQQRGCCSVVRVAALLAKHSLQAVVLSYLSCHPSCIITHSYPPCQQTHYTKIHCVFCACCTISALLHSRKALVSAQPQSL